MTAAATDLAALDAEELAAAVAEIADADLEAALASDGRELVLNEVFARMPDAFRPELAGGVEATVRWEIDGDPPYTRTMHLSATGCTLDAPGSDKPDVVLGFEPVAFIRLVTGTAAPLRLALGAGLRIGGSLPLALAVSGAFDVPGKGTDHAKVDPTTLDAVAFAREVGRTDDKALQAFMQTDARAYAIEGIFQRMEQHVRPDKVEGLDGAVMHWKIYDKPGGGYDHWEVVVENGEVRVTDQPQEEPGVTFRVKPVDFLKLVTGNAGPVRMALTRKLQIIGDIGLAKRVGDLFEIPKP